jgi:predicted SAM-dependent methyltransferase
MTIWGYSNFPSATFKNALAWELVGLWGRLFRRGRSRVRPLDGCALLDIGVGENYTPGWIHAGYYRAPRLWLMLRKVRLAKDLEVETDLRKQLNCRSNALDGVYSGHTLEHLYPKEALKLLSEIFRILKPGAWLRINVPDLGKYVAFYNGNIPHSEFRNFKSGAEALGYLTQGFGHHSTWDEELLGRSLREAGFVSVSRVEFGRTGSDLRLMKEQAIREWETLVMEAQKPMAP